MLKRPFLFLISFFCFTALYGQAIAVDDQVSPETLVTDFLINNACAQVRNVQTHVWESTENAPMGSFSSNGTNFPFDSGVVLTTGRAKAAEGPNDSTLSHGSPNWPGDLDLQQALGVYSSVNACILEFEFFPLGDQISFDYIFASEQYLSNPSANQCQYTDGFAFLLQPLGETTWQNLALVPGSNTPVAVNTVRGPGTICPEINSEYFDQFNTEDYPTNYNGQTKVMRAQAYVMPQQWYRIKLVVADQGNNLYDSAIFLGAGSFQITKDLGPDRLYSTNNPICPTENFTLNATQIGALSYQWFLNADPIPGATAATYTPTANGHYSVEVNLGFECSSTGDIQLEFTEFDPINNAFELTGCDSNNDGVARFNLNALADEIFLTYPISGLEFFLTQADAIGYDNWITNRSTFEGSNGQTLYIRFANEWGCPQIVPLQLHTTESTVFPDPIPVCLTEGNQTVLLNDLFLAQLAALLPSDTQYQFFDTIERAEMGLQPIMQLELAESRTLYVRGVQNDSCGGIYVFTLQPIGLSAEETAPVLLRICPNTATTLSAPQAASYNWSNGATTQHIIVFDAGTYTVELTFEVGCTASKTYTVELIEAPIYVSHQVSDFAANQNTLTIQVEQPELAVYSLDGLTYQSSPVFTGLGTGDYTFYIQDSAGCTTLGPYAFSVMDFPRFFTPNNDGHNDYWNIPSIGEERIAFTIYSRYGELLFSSDNQSQGWDGKRNGQPVPATDYWVQITKADGRRILGHFSLKR